jgi:hypothetical protein
VNFSSSTYSNARRRIIKAVRLDLGGLTKEFRLASTAAMGLNRAASMTTATAGIARTIAETNKLTAALGRASAAASRIGVGGGGGGNRIRLKATEHYPRLDHGHRYAYRRCHPSLFNRYPAICRHAD